MKYRIFLQFRYGNVVISDCLLGIDDCRVELCSISCVDVLEEL